MATGPIPHSRHHSSGTVPAAAPSLPKHERSFAKVTKEDFGNLVETRVLSVPWIASSGDIIRGVRYEQECHALNKSPDLAKLKFLVNGEEGVLKLHRLSSGLVYVSCHRKNGELQKRVPNYPTFLQRAHHAINFSSLLAPIPPGGLDLGQGFKLELITKQTKLLDVWTKSTVTHCTEQGRLSRKLSYQFDPGHGEEGPAIELSSTTLLVGQPVQDKGRDKVPAGGPVRGRNRKALEYTLEISLPAKKGIICSLRCTHFLGRDKDRREVDVAEFKWGSRGELRGIVSYTSSPKASPYFNDPVVSSCLKSLNQNEKRQIDPKAEGELANRFSRAFLGHDLNPSALNPLATLSAIMAATQQDEISLVPRLAFK